MIEQTNAHFDKVGSSLDDNVRNALGIFAKYRNITITYKGEYLKRLFPVPPTEILDFGCGIGLYEPHLKQVFPNAEVHGCDLSTVCVNVAKQNYTDCYFDAVRKPAELKIYKDKIDCVFINCVLHHIPFAEHSVWIDALYDILKIGGTMVVFEMNLYNPLVQIAQKKGKEQESDAVLLPLSYSKKLIKKCFDKSEDVVKTRLGGVKFGYTFLFPWRRKPFTSIEYALSRIPLGAQYYVSCTKK
jgi:ubiquinone/menaquinone biosynthesis C-methylase UbiE